MVDVDGKSVQIPCAAEIINDVTMIPVRAVAQLLGCEVLWCNNTVFINSPDSYNDACAAVSSKVSVYAPDGRIAEIDANEVEAYKNTGWYTEPVTLMYAADGRTMYSLESEVEANKGVGWYTEPVTLMYAADGRTMYSLQSDVEGNKCVGWYTEPVTLMYAADGRTMYVVQSEVEANKRVGWYTEPVYTLAPETESSSYNDASSSQVGTGIYITPTGKRYHYSASCAGRNAISTTLDKAVSSGYSPCNKCAR